MVAPKTSTKVIALHNTVFWGNLRLISNIFVRQNIYIKNNCDLVFSSHHNMIINKYDIQCHKLAWFLPWLCLFSPFCLLVPSLQPHFHLTSYWISFLLSLQSSSCIFTVYKTIFTQILMILATLPISLVSFTCCLCQSCWEIEAQFYKIREFVSYIKQCTTLLSLYFIRPVVSVEPKLFHCVQATGTTALFRSCLLCKMK